MTTKKTKHLFVCLTRMMLVTELLLLSGCATMGAKMALSIAKEEEAKGCEASYPGDGIAKVALEDCLRVSRLIKKAGVPEGFVGYDRNGRIKLKGSYINEDQVDRAHMVALTVVGVSSLDISPVTPRDLQEIKMVKSYTPQQDSNRTSNKYALLIGVSKFKQQGISDIITAKKDVEELQKILMKTGFNKQNIVTLTDEQATKNAILAAIRELEGKVSLNDTVVFYISTHGTPPDTFGKMGVIPYDLRSDIPDEYYQSKVNEISKNEAGDAEIIKIVNQRLDALKTAISFSDLQDFFTSIRSNKFTAILDTCYSGSALGALTYPAGGNQYAEREKNFSRSISADSKSEMLGDGMRCEIDQKSAYGQTALNGVMTYPQVDQKHKTCVSKGGLENYGSKTLYVDSLGDDQMPDQAKTANVNRVISNTYYQYESMENLRKAFGLVTPAGKGKVIITATSQNEKSQFNSSIFTNSYFTYYLIEGLKRYSGEIFPAFDYAQIRTRKVVSDVLYNCSQTPEMVSTPAACTNIDLSN